MLYLLCMFNLSLSAQWNSKKISDQQLDDEKQPLNFTPKQYNSPSITKKAPGIQNDIALNLFPDPSSGILTVNLENTLPQTNVCVYNATGKCVYNEDTVKKDLHEIDLSAQPKGVYLMEITSGDEKTVKKIVVE